MGVISRFRWAVARKLVLRISAARSSGSDIVCSSSLYVSTPRRRSYCNLGLLRRLCRPFYVAARLRVWLLLEFVELLFLLFIQDGAYLLVGLVAYALHFVMARLVGQARVPHQVLRLFLHSFEDGSDFGL